MGRLKGAKKQSIAQDTTVCLQLWSQMPSETFPSALLLWKPHHHTPFARTLTVSFVIYFVLVCFWDRILYVSVWPKIHYASGNKDELLILRPLPSTHLNNRHVPLRTVSCNAEIKPQASIGSLHSVLSYMPRRFSKSWSPNLTLFSWMVECLRLSR